MPGEVEMAKAVAVGDQVHPLLAGVVDHRRENTIQFLEEAEITVFGVQPEQVFRIGTGCPGSPARLAVVVDLPVQPDVYTRR